MSELPIVLPDATGYRLADKTVLGFEDDPSLSPPARKTISRFAEAYAPNQLTDTQRGLLSSTSPRTSSQLQRAFADDESDVARAFEAGLFGLLTAEQISAAANPTAATPPTRRPYPLSAGDVCRLTGATDRKLRFWEQAGLLTAYRPRKHRQYLRGAVLRASLLAKQPPYVVAFLRALALDPASLSSVIAAALSGTALEARQNIVVELGRAVRYLDDLNYAESSDGSGPVAIVISGPLLSRKSEVAKQLAERLGADYVSFGGYVRDVAAHEQRSTETEQLLDLGAELIERLGPDKFVDAAFASHAMHGQRFLVVDDVLHEAVLDALEERLADVQLFEVGLPEDREASEAEQRGLSLSEVRAHPLEQAWRQLSRDRPAPLRVFSTNVGEAVATLEQILTLAA